MRGRMCMEVDMKGGFLKDRRDQLSKKEARAIDNKKDYSKETSKQVSTTYAK